MLALLALQVVLGGVTVLLSNVAWTVVAHYGGAALLVASITLVAYDSPSRPPSRRRATRSHDSSSGSLRSALACCVADQDAGHITAHESKPEWDIYRAVGFGTCTARSPAISDAASSSSSCSS